MNKHLKNLSYILRHKWHVFNMGLKYRVWWYQLVLHDLSKFTPTEWFGYTNYFYARETVKKRLALLALHPDREVVREESAELTALLDHWKAKFNEAWNHHQKANKHHWQYWVLRNDDGKVVALKMPDRFVREMVADWAGASLAIRGYDDTLNWYAKNRDLMMLHEETRKRVEELIGYVSREVQLSVPALTFA